MSNFWSAKTVFITGGSAGIGEGLGRLLAKRGAAVGLIARRDDRLRDIAAQLESEAGKVGWASGDVTRLESLQAAVASLRQQLGACDVLVANAGVYRKTDAREWDPAAVQAVLDTNLGGVVNSISAVLPEMQQRGTGHLVAVASIASLLGLRAAAAYSASKAAVVNLMEGLRVDLLGTGIRVTTVCPGYVDTDLLTETERRSRHDILSVPQVAARICRAVERNAAESWFPWSTVLEARAARWLPAGLRARILCRFPPMEEVVT